MTEDQRAINAAAEAMAMTGTADLETLARAAVKAARPLICAEIAAQIEAAVVDDLPDRYKLWPSLDGGKCYPDLAAEAMNSVTGQDDYEDWWPVIQAGAFWDALEPVILRAAAAIARGEIQLAYRSAHQEEPE